MGLLGGGSGTLYGLAFDVTNRVILAADYAGGMIQQMWPLDRSPEESPESPLKHSMAGLAGPRDVHVWRAPKAALTLDRLIEDLNVAMLAVSRIRNSAVATRDAAARGDYIRMCTGVNYFRQNVDSQANNDVLIGPLDELRAAATNIGAALGCR